MIDTGPVNDFQGVGTFRQTGEGESALELILPLDDREFESALEAVQLVHSALGLQAIELVRSAHEALTSTLSFHGHLAGSKALKSATPLRFGLPGIVSLLFGWLSTCRLFLDHTDKDLCYRYGKTSPERARFKDATSWSYDHSLGYRFTYRLRNAFQHVSLSGFSVDVRRDEASGKDELRIVGRRDDLLAGFDGWGPVAADIERLPSQFDLTPLINGAAVQYEFLGAQVRDLFRRDAVAAKPVFDALVGQIEERDNLVLLDLRHNDDGSANFSPVPIDLEAADIVAGMPSYPASAPSDLNCIGDVTSSSPCAETASAIVTVPTKAGVALMPSCDLHQPVLGKWAVKNLGAAMVVHIGVAERVRAGLSAAGHAATTVISGDDARSLERTTGQLPNLDLRLTPSGWQLPSHPELQGRIELAVAVMGAWHDEGGGTARFFETVNEKIQEQGDVEPLITGLINLNATMLSMTASVLGRSPSALLGGLAAELSKDAPAAAEPGEAPSPPS